MKNREYGNKSDHLEEKKELLALLLKEKGLKLDKPPAITPRKAGKVPPLSSAQERLWFLHHLEPDSLAYSITRSIRLKGVLRKNALEKAYVELARRHEILRTTFDSTDGHPVLRIADEPKIVFDTVDLRHLPRVVREAEVRRLSAEDARKPFDLSRGPLLRIRLFQLEDEAHVLHFNMHHIISDFWSFGVMGREIAALYTACINDKPADLPELPIQYADYALWQRQWLQSGVLEAQLTYWKDKLGGELPVLELPTDRPRPAVQTHRGAIKSSALSKELTEALQTMSRREGVTLFMTLLAAFKTLLYRHTGQAEIIVGTPIAGRNRIELEGLIGFFVNTMVMRTDLAGEPSFRELLGRVRETALGAYAHQDMPFERLVEELSPERDLSRNALFQVFFNHMVTGGDKAIDLPGLEAVDVSRLDPESKFDMSLHVLEGQGGIELHLLYNTDLFDSWRMVGMLKQYQMLLESIVSDSDQRISELSLLTAAERHQLLVDWNATRQDYSPEKTLVDLFEEQVERSLDAIAVVYEDRNLIYKELNKRANQLAHHLSSLGVGPETNVGLCLERSFEMVVGILGILKAGGAYVPLDPKYPHDRLVFMLGDAQISVLLTVEAILADFPTYAGVAVCLDKDWLDIASVSDGNLKRRIKPDNPAYVIYTSGSTGIPKGVLITHAAICNHMLWRQQTYPLRREDRFLHKASLSFDISVWEIFAPLLAGARLILSRPGGQLDSAYLAELVVGQKVTTIHFSPTALQHFLEEKAIETCSSLKRVFCGGEALSADLKRKYFTCLNAELIQQYGPTETTVDVATWECKPEDDRIAVPIGYPVANTQVYILDANLQPVPVGVQGELYIGGASLARGYFNRPELTAEKFIPNSFSYDPAARLYKSGDLARYLPDGAIEFLGRKDFQVKLRGFRIELGEIDSVLGRHPAIREAVVIAREDVPGDKRLVAYIVASRKPPLTSSELRNFLKEKLPDYMIPSAFVYLDSLPLAPNGKVDRRALPTPEQSRSELESKFVAPGSPVEEAVAGIWCEVLGLKKVGMRDNFFDLGGHSLLIMRVHRKLQKIIGYTIPIITLFQYPTIGSLCRYLRREAIERTSFEQLYDRAERQAKAIHQRDIAIIGMSGRFPKAKTLDQLWLNLREGRECISFFSEEDLQSSGVNPALINSPDYVRASAELEDIDLFDASFFGINPREAEILDPRQRLFLECAWEALENSGCDTEKCDGLIGVFAGSSGGSYLQSNLLPNQRLLEALGGHHVAIGNNMGHLSPRVSYKLNLKGPSVTVQTTCSTSLVAVALACQSLLSYQCDTAIAGGVSIKIPQKNGYLYREGGILSPDGHCRAFDARAQGTVGGDGVGIVILKRLADALAEGDRIHAVIKGSAVNNDGSQKVGYTAPAVDGQADVIAMAQAIAGVKPETVSYIEAHGTGTPLGDPIELAALNRAYRAGTDKKGFCAIGSIKTNIGHLDAAAGVAGLIKTVLALENKLLPPSLHFEEPNPEIDFANSPFYVNTQLSEWTAGEGPRRAGVSSFGIGGTNAHVIVEEPPPQERSGPSRPRQLLLLSAKTDSALETATKNLVEHLKNQPDLNLADAAYTLQVGRREFSNRRVAVCQTVDDAVNALHTADPQRVFTALADMDDRPVVFMFSGQGSQYVNMGLELYRDEAAFREQIDLCTEILKPHLGLDLCGVLYPDEKNMDEATRRLTETSITQPALFTIEYALATLLGEWGIRPRATIGHSIGEYVSACLAGVFALEDALEVVARRGRLIQELPGGAMLAVALGEKEIRRLTGSKLSLAAVNGASGCVISGTEKDVAGLQSELAAEKVHCRRLHTSHAFHSEMMEPILSQFTQFLAKINVNPPEMRYISNVTGTWITDAEATDPTYWAKHLRRTVRFADGIAELLKMPDAILMEIGPGRTLATLARQQVNQTSDRPVLSSLPHPQEQESDLAFLLKTMGRLWLKGVKLDWTAFYGNERRKRISLPTYPFERQRYWIEPQTQATPVKTVRETVVKKPNIADWFYIPSWKRTTPLKVDNIDTLNQTELSWLIFIDEYGVGATTARRLKQAGQHVVCVAVGEKFTKVEDGFYRINPQMPDDYGELLRELGVLNNVPNKILHFWCVTPNERRDIEFELVERYQYLGFYSLLFIAQGLGKHCPDNFIQISVFSNNMREVTGGELVCPEKATLSGACKVIPQEYQNIKCRSIDLSNPVSDTRQIDRMINQIIYESMDLSSDTVVAYRGDYRWVETFEPLRLDKTPEMTPRLKEKGTYLITGGMGGIGFVLAEHLAKTLSANLILTGRSHFPAKDEWEQWLANHDVNDSTSQKIKKIQELEKLGAKFLIVRADVADLEQMQSVISKSEDIFGKINGVVHSAGIIDHGGVIQRRPLEKTAEILASKVTGTLVLNTVLADAELDFFVCCSSLGTVLYKSLFGEVGYCAANEFLDAFGYYRFFLNGSFTVTINWCGWSEVGMAVRAIDHFSEVYGAKIETTTAVSPSEGIDIFLRIIGSEHPRVAVSPQELGIAIEHDKSFIDIAPSREPEKPSHSRPDLPTLYAAPRNEQEQVIAEIWQELLGIQRIGIYDNYFELGGDSLLAAQIIARLRDNFEMEFPLARLFETPTIAGLTELIETIRLARPGPRPFRETTTSDWEEGKI